MKRFSLRLTIALLTFLTGAGLAWIGLTGFSGPAVQNVQITPECIPLYDASVSPGDYGAVDRVHRVPMIALQDGQPAAAGVTGQADIFARFQEPPLDRQPACVDESYRLTWVPTFHHPAVVRVWRSGEKFYLVTKRLDGMGGYGMGQYTGETRRALTPEEWTGFVNLLNEEVFWRMPARVNEPPVNDGAAWLLEGTNGGEYHNVFRTLPSDKLTGIFRHLFKLTKVETEYERYL